MIFFDHFELDHAGARTLTARRPPSGSSISLLAELRRRRAARPASSCSAPPIGSISSIRPILRPGRSGMHILCRCRTRPTGVRSCGCLGGKAMDQSADLDKIATALARAPRPAHVCGTSAGTKRSLRGVRAYAGSACRWSMRWPIFASTSGGRRREIARVAAHIRTALFERAATGTRRILSSTRHKRLSAEIAVLCVVSDDRGRISRRLRPDHRRRQDGLTLGRRVQVRTAVHHPRRLGGSPRAPAAQQRGRVLALMISGTGYPPPRASRQYATRTKACAAARAGSDSFAQAAQASAPAPTTRGARAEQRFDGATRRRHQRGVGPSEEFYARWPCPTLSAARDH